MRVAADAEAAVRAWFVIQGQRLRYIPGAVADDDTPPVVQRGVGEFAGGVVRHASTGIRVHNLEEIQVRPGMIAAIFPADAFQGIMLLLGESAGSAELGILSATVPCHLQQLLTVIGMRTVRSGSDVLQ